MANWAGLPNDVITFIARRLDLGELISFRGTCTSWRITTICEEDSRKNQWCPFLMINRVRDTVDSDDREFFDFYKRKVISISLPEIRNKVCIGSKGWFITIGSSGDMSLLNPITRSEIALPKLSDDESYCWVKRGILSASPKNGSGFVVMVVYLQSPKESNYLGFWKPDDPEWTKIETPESLTAGIRDVAYLNGMFYALSYSRKVYMIDVFGPDPIIPIEIIDIPRRIVNSPSIYQAFFVECGYTLLVVSTFHYIHPDCSPHRVLEIIELDFDKGICMEIASLGDKALFIGNNEGFCVDALKFPGVIRPDYVYQSNGSYQMVRCEMRRDVRPNVKAGVFYSDYDTSPSSSNYGNVWLTPEYP